MYMYCRIVFYPSGIVKECELPGMMPGAAVTGEAKSNETGEQQGIDLKMISYLCRNVHSNYSSDLCIQGIPEC